MSIFERFGIMLDLEIKTIGFKNKSYFHMIKKSRNQHLLGMFNIFLIIASIFIIVIFHFPGQN